MIRHCHGHAALFSLTISDQLCGQRRFELPRNPHRTDDGEECHNRVEGERRYPGYDGPVLRPRGSNAYLLDASRKRVVIYLERSN